MYCKACGTEIQAGTRFCPNCGAPAGDDVPTVASSPISTESSQEPLPVSRIARSSMPPPRKGAMHIAGGVLGLIGGLFGVIAAFTTLFLGGVVAAVGSHGGDTVIGLGWGGMVFSFLALIFGATAFTRPRGSGIGLIVVSILGAILGGTLVALCMVLSLVGGILAFLEGRRWATASLADGAQTTQGSSRKTAAWVLGGILALVVLLLVFAGMFGKKDATGSVESSNSDPLVSLQNATPSALRPDGELAELFQVGGNIHTDVQRENRLKEIKGQVVAWCLPVYDVKKTDEGYKVQTSGEYNIFGSGGKIISAFVYITPRNDQERQTIEALKEKDILSFKGIIDDVTMRSFDITPALLQPQTSCMSSSQASQASGAVQGSPASLASQDANGREPTSDDAAQAANAANAAAAAATAAAESAVANAATPSVFTKTYDESKYKELMELACAARVSGNPDQWITQNPDKAARVQALGAEIAAQISGNSHLSEAEADKALGPVWTRIKAASCDSQ